jgi:DNA-binding transcriptional MocR family regulator
MTPAQLTYHAHRAHQILPHGARPTKLHLKIARLLARWQNPMPSHAKLARAAGCCVRTVQNALNRFRDLGLLTWRHQAARMRSGQWLRLPNRYRFMATFLLSAGAAKEEGSKIQTPNLSLGKLPNWTLKPPPHPPVRTVAQQLAILMAG